MGKVFPFSFNLEGKESPYNLAARLMPGCKGTLASFFINDYSHDKVYAAPNEKNICHENEMPSK